MLLGGLDGAGSAGLLHGQVKRPLRGRRTDVDHATHVGRGTSAADHGDGLVGALDDRRSDEVAAAALEERRLLAVALIVAAPEVATLVVPSAVVARPTVHGTAPADEAASAEEGEGGAETESEQGPE